MKFAWIENEAIRDIAWTDPTLIYHHDVAKLYDTEVPDDAENGDGWVKGKLVKQPKPKPVEPVPAPRQWTTTDFRNGMTLAEKVIWDNDSAPEVKTVKTELPKELAGATELLAFLVDTKVISQSTMDKILG